MDDRETVEHIPWAELTSRPGIDQRLVYAAVGMAALIVGVLAGKVFLSGGEPTPLAPTTMVVASSTTTTTTLPLYSEADLYAADVTSPERAAATRAEWFVTDFFTTDLDPAGGADVRAALPDGSELPSRGDETAGAVGYVEWARALRVEPIGRDTYRVDVAFRAVGAPPERGFLRLPVKGVAVTVAVASDGGTTVVDLPSPIVLPAGPEPVPWPETEAQAPAEVVAGAVTLAAAWGSEPRLIASQSIAQGWRMVMTVTDEAGNRWPLALKLDATGRAVG